MLKCISSCCVNKHTHTHTNAALIKMMRIIRSQDDISNCSMTNVILTTVKQAGYHLKTKWKKRLCLPAYFTTAHQLQLNEMLQSEAELHSTPTAVTGKIFKHHFMQEAGMRMEK